MEAVQKVSDTFMPPVQEVSESDTFMQAVQQVPDTVRQAIAH